MSAKARPFPIVLEVEFLDRLHDPVRDGRAKSVSEIIRTALERYDFSNIVVVRPSQVMISVRLAPEIRKNLKHISRTKHTSIGQLVRAAVEAYLPELESGAVNQLEISAVPPPALVESVLASRAKPKRKKKKVKTPPKQPSGKKSAVKNKGRAARTRRTR